MALGTLEVLLILAILIFFVWKYFKKTQEAKNLSNEMRKGKQKHFTMIGIILSCAGVLIFAFNSMLGIIMVFAGILLAVFSELYFKSSVEIESEQKEATHQSKKQQSKKYCSKCGKLIKKDATYCEHCGKKQ